MRVSAAHLGLNLSSALALWYNVALADGEYLQPVLSDQELAVFDWDAVRCDSKDIPDAPARALRDSKNDVHLFTSHHLNRIQVGASFSTLKHSCQLSFASGYNDDPNKYSDRQWLASFYTEDGNNIAALVHNEYHGHVRPFICPSGAYMGCWYNSITFAISNDGGYSFRQNNAPANLVMAPPYAYMGDIGHPVGYFQPTNMVRSGDYVYTLIFSTQWNEQKRGACVARTKNPFQLDAWRAWNGESFSASLAGAKNSDNPRQHICDTVGNGSIFELGSLSFDPRTGLYLLITYIFHGDGGVRFGSGVYIVTSTDLLRWSTPILIASELDLGSGGDPPLYVFRFFSLIDEASESRTYDVIANEAKLYLYYVKLKKNNGPYSRTLVKRELTLLPRKTNSSK